MFTTDSRTENFLRQLGVAFKYTNDVKVTDLAPGWNQENLARPVPVREDAVLEYATLTTEGSEAPAPILIRRQDGWHVLDGIQRISAAEMLGSTRFSAYTVTCDSEDMVAAIRVLANARLQGRAEPMEWTRRRSVEVLVVERGLSVEEVSRMGGWRPTAIARLAESIRWGQRIVGIGGPELPDTLLELLATQVELADLGAAPQPIAEFLALVKTARFSADDAVEYFQDFFAPVAKASKRFSVYQERLETFRSQPEVQVRIHGRRGGTLPKDIVLRRSLKAADTVLDEILAEGDVLLNVDEFFRMLRVLDEKLKTLQPKSRDAGKRR